MRNTYCLVKLDAIESNLDVVRSVCDSRVKVCAVVKANAYGHGLVPVAKRLESCGVDYLAVAIADEGVTLRSNGIRTPILVLAAVDHDDIEACIANDLTITASSLIKLQRIAEQGVAMNKVPVVHLKIDTGMNRIGINWQRAEPLLEEALRLVDSRAIVCQGIYTHFSDSLDYEFTKLQFDRFTRVVDRAKLMGLPIPIAHACSSRSVFMYPEFHLDMVRPGFVLYGIEPEIDRKILPPTIVPVLEWKTKVVYFKAVTRGESIGYGRSWTADEEFSRIVTIPVGYADGFPRRLSNCGSVIIRGTIYPIVGRICMDQAMVSLGISGEAYLDDEVTLIGAVGDVSITAESIAQVIGTTPHEVVACISDRVPRVYV